VKTKSVSRVIRTVLVVSILCLLQMSVRITQGLSPNTVAAQGDHIEILSYSMGIGLVPDQTLRITVLDPNQLQREDVQEPARARITLFLADGSPIRQSPELLIPEGGFNFVDFRRTDLPVPGDSLTGRVQVLAKVMLFVRDPRPTGLSPVSGEIINATTGQTQVYGGFVGGVRVASADLD
jgi:hypothetical protein